MDWNSAEGKKLDERLRQEQVIWLTTVRPDGTPSPTPVWFLWDGSRFLIYTQPHSAKLKYIAQNGKAALNLNSDEWGGAVAVFTGALRVAAEQPLAAQNPAYLAKYRGGIQDLQMTPESFSADYSTALIFDVQQVRAW